MSKELKRLNEQRQIIQDAKEYLKGILWLLWNILARERVKSVQASTRGNKRKCLLSW